MIESISDLLPGKHAVFERMPGLQETAYGGYSAHGGQSRSGYLLWRKDDSCLIRLYVLWDQSNDYWASIESRLKAERASVDACADVPTGMNRYVVDTSLHPHAPGAIVDLGVAP